MSEQFTPTTGEVRSWYMETWSGPDGRRGLAFDRWLAERDAEVAAKAWDEGKIAGVEHGRKYERYRAGKLTESAYVAQRERLMRNPYRKAVQS